jgi:hypothetical protein
MYPIIFIKLAMLRSPNRFLEESLLLGQYARLLLNLAPNRGR